MDEPCMTSSVLADFKLNCGDTAVAMLDVSTEKKVIAHPYLYFYYCCLMVLFKYTNPC